MSMKRNRQNMETKLEKKVDYLEQRLNNLSTYEINGLHETIKTIIESLAGILKNINHLEDELGKTDENVEEIGTDINNLKRDVNNLKRDVYKIYDDTNPEMVYNSENKSQNEGEDEG